MTKKIGLTIFALTGFFGCATSKKIEPIPTRPNFDKLQLEFVSGETVWGFPADCRAELGDSATIIETQVKDRCENLRPDNDLTILYCDGSNDMKVKLKDEKNFRFFPTKTSCKQMLQTLGYVFIESSPPGADIIVDEKFVGRTPRWFRWSVGAHSVTCQNTRDVFKPTSVKFGESVHVLCERQNQQSSTMTSDDLTGEEKAGGILVYLGAGLVSLAALVLPFFFLF